MRTLRTLDSDKYADVGQEMDECHPSEINVRVSHLRDNSQFSASKSPDTTFINQIRVTTQSH